MLLCPHPAMKEWTPCKMAKIPKSSTRVDGIAGERPSLDGDHSQIHKVGLALRFSTTAFDSRLAQHLCGVMLHAAVKRVEFR